MTVAAMWAFAMILAIFMLVESLRFVFRLIELLDGDDLCNDDWRVLVIGAGIGILHLN